MRGIVLSVLILSTTGCMKTDTLTQADAATPTQAHMIARAKQWEPALGIGEFVLVFGKVWRATSAAETGCPQNGKPWWITINAEWIESERAQAMGQWYFDELLAHEMCHVWLEHGKKGCATGEDAANVCGHSLVTTGRPK